MLKRMKEMKITKDSFVRLVSIVGASAIIFVCPLLASKGPVVTIPFVTGIAVIFALFCFVIWFVEGRQNVREALSLPKKAARLGGYFDWGMHYFRAFAIMAIMLCHYVSWHEYDAINNIFFTTSTIFFLFISGYLCQFLYSRKKDGIMSYYRKKILNVICPFVVFSIVFALLKGDFVLSIEFAKFLLLGRVQGQYWYIPFVSVLFFFSPIICRIKNSSLLLVTVIAAFFWMMFPIRPGKFTLQWPHIFYFYAYFTVFYLFGFLYCRHKGQIDYWLKVHKMVILAGALLGYVIIWNPPILQLKTANSGILIGVQRLLMSLCVIMLLDKIKNRRIWLLDQIAKYSFTLYFIHFAVFIQFEFLRQYILSYLTFLPLIISEMLIYCGYLVIMLSVSIIFKNAFGRYSRCIMGS